MPANWPSPRRLHWQALLQARAIENQAYVVGCNRVGTAGDGTEHVGDSRIVSPMGELLATASAVETVLVADVDAAEVTATRDRFRFLRRPPRLTRPGEPGRPVVLPLAGELGCSRSSSCGRPPIRGA